MMLPQPIGYPRRNMISRRHRATHYDDIVRLRVILWALGALTVLPQPQLQGASGTVLPVRFELSVSHSLC